MMITADSKIVHAPRCTLRKLENELVAGTSNPVHYTPSDRLRIAWLYWDTCTVVGVDPLIAVAQLVLETKNLTSKWSQRPRRNPAGIEVELPPGHPDYLKVGVRFPGWSWAVRAHVGRLLAYGSLPKSGSLGHWLVNEANVWRRIPTGVIGKGATVGTLAKAGWATDPDYAHKLVAVANRIAAR
jgi:hypothetical protein